VNAKIDKKKPCIIQTNYKHFQGGMEDYNWAMFTHAMEFFKEHTNLKNLIVKRFFTHLPNNLSTEDLVTFSNLLSINS
jgi:hypothetical protein